MKEKNPSEAPKKLPQATEKKVNTSKQGKQER